MEKGSSLRQTLHLSKEDIGSFRLKTSAMGLLSHTALGLLAAANAAEAALEIVPGATWTAVSFINYIHGHPFGRGRY